jgi:hypothetical protein
MDIITVFNAMISNWQDVLMGGVILTCAIIFVMGILKTVVLGKITNKLVRKIVLAFTSLFLVFPSTALYFVSDNINFDYYWYACALVGVATIVTYWFYENTGFRNLIHLIGQKTVGKYVAIIEAAALSDQSDDVTKAQLITVNTELKQTVKEEVAQELANRKSKDNDLNAL